MWSSPLLCEPWEHQRVQVPGKTEFVGAFCGKSDWGMLWQIYFGILWQICLGHFVAPNHDTIKIYLPSREMEKGNFSDFRRTGFVERSFAQFGKKTAVFTVR